ncbi:MAG: hypothetical protein ACRDRS_08525 [Pseudonocardiaceae bacterium]
MQRHRKRGATKHYVYTYPAKKALRAVMAKVKTVCRQTTNLPLEALLYQLNRMLRGWPPTSSRLLQCDLRLPADLPLETGHQVGEA